MKIAEQYRQYAADLQKNGKNCYGIAKARAPPNCLATQREEQMNATGDR